MKDKKPLGVRLGSASQPENQWQACGVQDERELALGNLVERHDQSAHLDLFKILQSVDEEAHCYLPFSSRFRDRN